MLQNFISISRSWLSASNKKLASKLQRTSLSSLSCLVSRSNQAYGSGPFGRCSTTDYLKPMTPSLDRQFSSPSFTKLGTHRKRQFIPRKAAVKLTEKARTFFKALLENNPQKDGIILNYQQASSGQPRMVFSFGFVSRDQMSVEDEG